MLTSNRFVNALARRAAIPLIILPALALPSNVVEAQQIECANRAGGQFKAVVTSTPRTATVDFSGSGGQLDPVPLLETEINGPGCVVVHFSAQAAPQDNFIVFQASIDDIPMEGHAQFPYLTPAPSTPVVFDPEETNLNISRMVSYTFFKRVGPGSRAVRIRYAGCCSPNPGSGLVLAASMTVNY